MTEQEIEKLIQEDLECEGIKTHEIAIRGYEESKKSIGIMFVRVVNIHRFSENVANIIKERVSYFTEETGIEVKKLYLEV